MVIYGKEGCHLCEAVEAEVRSKGTGIALTVVDVERDATLQSRYLIRVPVVTVGGKEVFEANMMDPQGEWRKRLLSLLASS